MARIRTFFAVEVAADVHAALVRLKHELARHDSGVRWVRDENLHATVKFLGGVEEAQLAALRDAAADAVATYTPLAADVAGLGAFPSLKRPRVVWAGLRCAALAQVAAAVERAVEPFGYAPERRAFRAHITLGRIADLRGWAPVEASLRAREQELFGRCTIAELAAFRSDLRRDGAVYTKLWTIPFGG